MAKNPQEMVISYHRVRQAVGILGLLLPVVVLAGAVLSNTTIEASLSDFYHSLQRDLYVGILFAIGTFLISYRGYPSDDKEYFTDDRMATICGALAYGVALFPNHIPQNPDATSIQIIFGAEFVGLVHHISATLLLLCLAYFCFFKFTRVVRAPWRKKVYIGCGYAILLFTVLTYITSILRKFGPETISDVIEVWSLIFIFEALGIWAFAISWLVKGISIREMAEEATANLS